ncbi:MAG: Bax inhibitor-1/YccA family protein [Acidimicrobiales bacterium]|nr:Bax inhibitor-1/YccA family protein [Acidimicrobiales bacterium]
MSNPVLTRGFSEEDLRPGFAAADTAAASTGWGAAGVGAPATEARVMTYGNTMLAVGVCFVLLLVGGGIGWALTSTGPAGQVEIPGWIIFPLFAALGLVLWGSFRPRAARIAAPLYAITEGVVLGAVSKAFEAQWDGIVLQAVMATASVFLVVLAIYALRIVRVTNRFIMGVVAATAGLMLMYLVAFVLSLFGVDLSFVYGSGPGAIIFSVIAVVIASLNLMIDFAIVERGVEGRAPAYMEWFAALGLMVTVVWLYLEMLRLIARLRQ